MKYYVGIDLHSNNSYLAILDENGNKIFKQRVPNHNITILNTLKPFKRRIKTIAVESTYNWYWLVDMLQEQGYHVALANPAAMVQYKGLKYSDDKSDAIWIAELLRLNILPTGYIHPAKDRSVRDLLRKRIQLVQHRSSLLVSMKSMLHNWTGESISRSWAKDIRPIELRNMLHDENNLQAALSLKEVIDCLSVHINDIEKNVLSQVKLTQKYKKLLSVWGIGPVLATIIMLETGDISRFGSVGDYSSYCRCVPSKRISNEKKKGVGNKKNGNKYLAWAYIEAAQYMQQYHSTAKSWFQKKVSKTNNLVARKALSNKIARACYFIMRDQCTFNPVKLFG